MGYIDTTDMLQASLSLQDGSSGRQCYQFRRSGFKRVVWTTTIDSSGVSNPSSIDSLGVGNYEILPNTPAIQVLTFIFSVVIMVIGGRC